MSTLPDSILDPYTGMTQTFIENGSHCAFKYSQDTDPVFDANKQTHLYGDGYSPSREIKHIARVPLVIAYEWLYKHGVDILNPEHKPAVRRLLDSSEYAYLRTGGGSLGTRKFSKRKVPPKLVIAGA
jgi:hypothetical protein